MATNGVMEANGKCGHPPPKISVWKNPLPPKSQLQKCTRVSGDEDDAAEYEGDR